MIMISCESGVLRKSGNGWKSLEVFSALIAGDPSREKPSGFVVNDAARIRMNRS